MSPPMIGRPSNEKFTTRRMNLPATVEAARRDVRQLRVGRGDLDYVPKRREQPLHERRVRSCHVAATFDFRFGSTRARGSVVVGGRRGQLLLL
ncbi:MAG: hypothetical protein M1816_004007 [Peltula sp. TS41687]|nr:MAG: hypothetical protein M1816_004007 [Peltula sp. TS41687]